MGKGLEIGKRYTWEEVVEAYPGKWVRMSDCNLTVGSGIIDGILIGVYADDNVDTVMIKMHQENSKDELQRTTFGFNVGVIECLNAEMGVEVCPRR